MGIQLGLALHNLADGNAGKDGEAVAQAGRAALPVRHKLLMTLTTHTEHN